MDGLEGARRDAEGCGGRALVLPLDVADADAVNRAAERVEREVGPIDVWVNDAMVSVFSPVARMTAHDFRRVTEVTYKDGTDTDKEFKLTDTVRYVDSTGKEVTIDVFKSGDEVLVLEAEGELKEVKKCDKKSDKP